MPATAAAKAGGYSAERVLSHEPCGSLVPVRYWCVPQNCFQTPARDLRAGMEPQKAQVLCMSRPKAHAGTCAQVAATSRRKTRLSSSSQLIAEGGCSMPVCPAASCTRRSWRGPRVNLLAFVHLPLLLREKSRDSVRACKGLLVRACGA